MLTTEKLVAFGATTDGTRAAAFYGGVLGLPIRSDDAFAITFDANGAGTKRVEKFREPKPFTALGWQVADIGRVVKQLAASQIATERYSWLEQDSAGVWTSPSGARIAWFKDPDGNLLSVAQYPAG